MIDRQHALPIIRQALLLGISRGTVYYLPKPTLSADLALMRRLDELHLKHPFESPRVLRRLQHFREWSHEEIEQVFPGSTRTCCANSARAPQGLSIAMGGHRVDRPKDWLCVADAA